MTVHISRITQTESLKRSNNLLTGRVLKHGLRCTNTHISKHVSASININMQSVDENINKLSTNYCAIMCMYDDRICGLHKFYDVHIPTSCESMHTFAEFHISKNNNCIYHFFSCQLGCVHTFIV